MVSILRGAAQAVLAIMEEEGGPADERPERKRRPYGAAKSGQVAYRPFLAWEEAVNLIKHKKLDPDHVVVLDLENIEMGLGFVREKRE